MPPGLNEDVIRFISAKKQEPEWLLEWRLKAYRHWLTLTRAALGERPVPAHRLPGHQLLLRAEARRTARRAWTRSTPSCWRPTRSWASRSTSRSGWPAWPWTPSSTASRWPPPSRRSSAELGIIFCSFSEAVREHPELVRKYLGSVVPLHGQLLRRAELRRLHRRLLRLHPQGRALPDGAVHLLPHQRGQHRPVRAHADRRRRGRLRQLPRGLHRAHARREPAPRRRGRARRPRATPRSSTPRCRTGTPATRTARAASTTSSPSAAPAPATAPRSPGPRWRPARRSPGSTRAASCRATTRSASSTRWR